MFGKFFYLNKQKENCSHNSKHAINQYTKNLSAKIEGFDLLIKNLENFQWRNEFQKQIVLENIEKSCKRAQHSSKVAISMFEEVKMKSSLLKVTCVTVPKDILPPNYSCTLYDVKISSNKSDDFIYKENKWIRDNVTRGMNFMELTQKEENFFDFGIYANKKFMGENGDEDYLEQLDIDKMCEKFFLDSPMNATEVICMTKLDGEVGHFSVRKIGEEYYIIAGSKNVHILYKTYTDIEKYTESRFSVAKELAKSVLDIFYKMDESKRRILEHFLNTTKSTIVCELLKPHHQHIINCSHLRKSTIYGLMMTSLPGEEGTNNSLTTIPPNMCLEYFKFFGISTPDYYSISVNDVKENIDKMRRFKQIEGFVLYYLIKDRTIGLTKVKTIWYVIVRAIREKSEYNCKKKKKKPLPDRINEIKTRLDGIQKWLGFCDKCLDKWKDLGEAFLCWISQEIEENRNISKNNRPEFNMIWKEFVENCHKNYHFCCSDF
ncbi:hypothetical protein Avbf_06696 [Armadillidium vulgare]|nr:hypothetical protein Avbf_06696 [Armadillidium vulgare]